MLNSLTLCTWQLKVSNVLFRSDYNTLMTRFSSVHEKNN